MLRYKVTIFPVAMPFRDPLALSSGAGARLALALGVLVVLWGCVAWALAL